MVAEEVGIFGRTEGGCELVEARGKLRDFYGEGERLFCKLGWW